VGGGLDPLASIVEAGVGIDGVDNAFRGGSDGFGLLDEEAESVAEIAVAAGEETQSVGSRYRVVRLERPNSLAMRYTFRRWRKASSMASRWGWRQTVHLSECRWTSVSSETWVTMTFVRLSMWCFPLDV